MILGNSELSGISGPKQAYRSKPVTLARHNALSLKLNSSNIPSLIKGIFIMRVGSIGSIKRFIVSLATALVVIASFGPGITQAAINPQPFAKKPAPLSADNSVNVNSHPAGAR